MLASHQTWLCFFNNKHFEYDRFGNLITKKRGENQSLVTYYEYDCRHRLIKVIKPSGQTITYSNEPFNLSTSKTVNGKTTEFIWQGHKLIAETNNAQQGTPPILLIAKRPTRHAIGLTDGFS